MKASVRYWAVVPAAGAGKRMQSDVPKQYLEIHGKPVIEYTLEAFISHPLIESVIVAVSDTDGFWPELPVSRHPKIQTAKGGLERCHSVLNCLEHLQTIAGSDDWVLVHDAARPCLIKDDIDKLICGLSDTDGGLLALPVRDTMKRAENSFVKETVNREGLWHALTPQMFRLSELQQSLNSAVTRGDMVTDESQAMEKAGYKPRLVKGRPENIKITHRADLALAELYLSRSATCV